MKTKYLQKVALSLAVCAGALAGVSVARAQSVTYQFSVNTSTLVGNTSAPFSLDFQLTDGSGNNDGNNTATLSNFSFGGGGAPFGSANLSGNASGSLAAGVTLTDSVFFNEFYQSFTPGTTLSFDLTLTTHVDGGGTPDAFSFSILDNNTLSIPTTMSGDFLLFANIDSASPVVQIGNGRDAFGGVSVAAVPEPGTVTLAGLGLAAVVVLRRRRTVS
jgi:hypothetical protein